MVKRCKNKIRAWLKDVLYDPSVQYAADCVLLAVTFGRRNEEKRHILVAAPGMGNIGDQSMLEAFIENVQGAITVIVGNKDHFIIPQGYEDRVQFLELKALLYGRLPTRLKDSLAYFRLLRNARSVSVVGADIMDGAYNWRASVNRANITRLARKMKVPTRVLGFSWNGQAQPQALAALKAASADGVRLFLRDPLSAQRAQADGLQHVCLTADTVFAAKTIDDSALRELLAQFPTPADFAVVNVSALLQRSVPQVEPFVEIIRHLRKQGLNVIILPHVLRPNSSDMDPCREVYAALDGETGVLLVERQLLPAQVRGLTKEARLVVTGRMHLAIMAFYNAVPAITLASQGKVEGLMQALGKAQLCVLPEPGFAKRVIAAADALLQEDSQAREELTQRVKAVQRIAALNFADMEEN